MSRVRLYFKGLRNFEFPRNYDDKLSYIFVSKIKGFIKDTVDYRDFDFYPLHNSSYDHFLPHDTSFHRPLLKHHNSMPINWTIPYDKILG